MFTFAALSTPLTVNQLGRYNGLQYFFGSNPNAVPWITPIGDFDNDGYDDFEIAIYGSTGRYIAYGYAPGISLPNLPKTSQGFTPFFPDSVPIDLDRPSPVFFNNKPLFEKYNSTIPAFEEIYYNRTNRPFEIGEDINGDGLKELFVENKDLPIGRRNYVLFGKPEGFSIADISTDPGILDGKNGFYTPPAIFEDFTGDVNGDGISDLYFNNTYEIVSEGNVIRYDSFVFFGTKDGFPGVLSADLVDGKNGFRDDFGLLVLGDINGDGANEIFSGNKIAFSGTTFPEEIDFNLLQPGLISEVEVFEKDDYNKG